MTQARQATPTVTFVDAYCALYQDIFPDVRSFEHFKHLHVGMLAEIKRQTLPAIAKAVGESDPQALHHFVANAPWSVEDLRARRLTKLKLALAGRAFTLGIDETGDRKKGKTTDHVGSQYIGNIGKLAVTYPLLRVEIKEVEIKRVRSLPPSLLRPTCMEPFDL